MSRTMYLAIFSNGPRPAHQSIFIPTGNNGKKGKLIHIDGNPAYGFWLEFLRNFDFDDFVSLFLVVELGLVEGQYVKDIPGNGKQSKDTIARDRLESVATMVPPPGRSLNPFDPANWADEYVRKLVEEGYLDTKTIAVFENAPKVLREND
ncbi:uncharacterized protein BDV14DRAFT_196470 [Aspergillus stella-maris]|uniref:uncharacterized protein n=1 Tax=Aspergillus stella-maris TaxID=1810926 RepID=UPI003CCDBBAD